MAYLDDLFKYKDKVVLNSKSGKGAKTVWVKILGDEDLKEAFKFSRIASATKREQLRDTESDSYKDQIGSLKTEFTRAEWEELILASKENEFSNNAPIVVPREELPDIKEIAVEPDAPTLEELERLDKAEKETNDKFKTAIEEYIQTKIAEVKAGLAELTDEKIFELAIVEFINIQSLQAFLEELNQQKAFRGTFQDEECTKRAFSSIEGYKNAAGIIKQQLIEKYNELEANADDVKN